MSIKIYFFLFLIYATIGWLIEVVGQLIKVKKFVNRGFMIGPYCPIYGVGGVLISIILKDYVSNPFVLFCVAIVICGALEYLTSYIMEKVFKARWWDYSKNKFNINGRICLETLIPFGILGCVIMYVSNPIFIYLLNMIPENILNVLFYVLSSIYLIDLVISFAIIFGLRKTVKTVNTDNPSDNTEEITKQVKEILRNKGVLNRRLIDAFPKVSIEKVKQKIKEKTVQVKENVAKVKDEATEKIKESAAKVKETTIKAKEETAEKIKEGANKVKKSLKKDEH